MKKFIHFINSFVFMVLAFNTTYIAMESSNIPHTKTKQLHEEQKQQEKLGKRQSKTNQKDNEYHSKKCNSHQNKKERKQENMQRKSCNRSCSSSDSSSNFNLNLENENCDLKKQIKKVSETLQIVKNQKQDLDSRDIEEGTKEIKSLKKKDQDPEQCDKFLNKQTDSVMNYSKTNIDILKQNQQQHKEKIDENCKKIDRLEKQDERTRSHILSLDFKTHENYLSLCKRQETSTQNISNLSQSIKFSEANIEEQQQQVTELQQKVTELQQKVTELQQKVTELQQEQRKENSIPEQPITQQSIQLQGFFNFEYDYIQRFLNTGKDNVSNN